MTERKPYLWQKKPGVWYVRRKGQYARIHAPEGTADFDREYWEIIRGQVKVKTTWAALIASYERSDRWRGLKPRTQADYQLVLNYLIDRAGGKDATTTKRRNIIAAMDANRHRVRFANYIAQVQRVLFEHAKDIGWMDENPAQGIRLIKMPKDKEKAHIVWPDWAVERWRSEASEWHRLAFEIGVGTVQRPSDWLRFKWSDFDGKALEITQGKTDRQLWIPCTDRLLLALKSTERNGIYIITKSTGQPITYNALARRMYDERKRLDLLDYDLHALRYRGVEELAYAGCTDEEIESYSGHTSKAMIAKYAGRARQRMRAKQAKEKRR